MATLKIGKVRQTHKGVYDPVATYTALDTVTLHNDLYQAVQDTPPDREPGVFNDYWLLIGIRGAKGDKGDAGAPGARGTDGRDGAQGVQGAQGTAPAHRWAGTTLAFENPDGTWSAPVNIQGQQGIQGPEGPVGPQGIPGALGPQGPLGPQGIAGTRGLQGERGLQGLQGTKGDKGDRGDAGSVPSGVITMWWGTLATIPAGWVLCDGRNNTPDLRDRFVVGAGGGYNLGDNGGANSVTPYVWLGGAGTGIGIQNTTLDGNTLPVHAHGIPSGILQTGDNQYRLGWGSNYNPFHNGGGSNNSGASWGHSHGIADPGHVHSTAAHPMDNRPPFYALFYIKKL